MDPEAEEETSCHWAHHLVREVLKESVHDVRMKITARGRETKRERKVQAVKMTAVTPSTNACRSG